MDNITKSKAHLVIDQPFFATLLLNMPMIEDNRIPTMGTDGEKIVYNKAFAESLTLPEMTFVLAHEVLHCVFQHMYRKNGRNHNKWNIAADFIINDLLHNEKIGTMPKLCLFDPKLVAKGKGTTEGVYNLLPDSDEDKQAGNAKQGGSFDDCMDGAKDEAEAAQKEAEMKVRISQAQNAAKAAGKLSAGLERLVSDFIKPSVDWRVVLRNFLTEKSKTEYSYGKPKRRFMGEMGENEVCFPGLTGERVGNIVVAVDCSGSICDEILKKFGSEIKGIIEDVTPTQVSVVYFDSEVLRTDTFTPEDEFYIKPIGGGGTAFSPIFKAVEKQNLEPVGLVVLTDLQCSDFGESPSYPVLWATTDLTIAPFGEIIKLK